MDFTMDSTFKRAIFIVIDIAIGILFLYTAFLYLPDLNQQSVIIYFVVIQALFFATFFTFRKQHAYRLRSVKKLKNPRLQENAFEFSDLLMKDYDYIRDTLSQAMNDRHTMVNYFLIIISAIVTIISTNLGANALQNAETRYLLMIFAYLVNFIGWIYFMKVVRLRQSWHGSALAMNQIKEFFIQNGRVPDDIARSAFLWDTKTVPKAGRKSNVFYYSAVLISLIASISLVFASFITSPAKTIMEIPVFAWLFGLYHFVFQVFCYSIFLDYRTIRR